MKTPTLVTIEFFSGPYGNNAKSINTDFPAVTNGAFSAGKKRLVSSLKIRMSKFYPKHRFIFNFTEVR